VIETERMILRRWRDADRAPYAGMMADPEVGYWLGGTLTEARSHAQIDQFATDRVGDEPGFLALERRGDGAFLGAACLRTVPAGHPMSGAIEVGWRLARWAWGGGYATEAARALIAEGFDRLGVEEIVSFTAASNARSRAVMERLGFSRSPARDFDHPALNEEHPLRAHVVYVLSRSAWPAAKPG
jgi:RimJ/RimL family protein N-acetyltransferase